NTKTYNWVEDKSVTDGPRSGFKKVLSENYISDEVLREITPCGSRAGVIYGLPKIHKDGVPLRPIISAIVSQLDPNEDSEMLSFDFESLFTNVPTLETIEQILDLAYKEGRTLFYRLKRIELKHLLIVCTQESHFQFNGEYFDQTDGVAMGSLLGPLFANIFMSEFEKKHMVELKKLGLISCLLNRIEAICSEENDIISEKQKLKTILLKNQYPQDIIEEEFKRFENKKPKQLENIEGSILCYLTPTTNVRILQED
ncbi:unnamed protein product, partial [Brachionus calyciflorus]